MVAMLEESSFGHCLASRLVRVSNLHYNLNLNLVQILMADVVPTALEKELNQLKAHGTFRLWLTTEPHPRFPPVLLQKSLKVQSQR